MCVTGDWEVVGVICLVSMPIVRITLCLQCFNCELLYLVLMTIVPIGLGVEVDWGLERKSNLTCVWYESWSVKLEGPLQLERPPLLNCGKYTIWSSRLCVFEGLNYLCCIGWFGIGWVVLTF